jgi:hypothetical protein
VDVMRHVCPTASHAGQPKVEDALLPLHSLHSLALALHSLTHAAEANADAIVVAVSSNELARHNHRTTTQSILPIALPSSPLPPQPSRKTN